MRHRPLFAATVLIREEAKEAAMLVRRNVTWTRWIERLAPN